jgi:hypothetical protein
MARSGAFWVDGIGPVLGFMTATMATRVMDAMEDGKEEVEQYARDNAPWADRTGQARNGLIASVYEDSGEIVLELAHTVDYGEWLELIQDGRFAIIMPTLEALGADIIHQAGGQVTSTGSTF